MCKSVRLVLAVFLGLTVLAVVGCGKKDKPTPEENQDTQTKSSFDSAVNQAVEQASEAAEEIRQEAEKLSDEQLNAKLNSIGESIKSKQAELEKLMGRLGEMSAEQINSEAGQKIKQQCQELAESVEELAEESKVYLEVFRERKSASLPKFEEK